MLLPALGLLLQTQGAPHSPPPAPADSAAPAVVATAAVRTPVIDGRDDDEAWSSAQLISGFREARPVEDGDPRLPTTGRVTYDGRHLFVFVRAFDPHPDSIIRRLARRDNDAGADWITIYVDSYHDRRTGYRFSVTPVGVKLDAVLYDDGNQDFAWDGVWDVATRIDSTGWTAEFAIPLSQLRYPTGVSTFGLLIQRYIARYTSSVTWPLLRQSRPGLASQMGELNGLAGLAPPRRAELTPYLVTRNVDVPTATGRDRRQRVTAGADLKYSVASNLTLTGTVNPDFGQVEADPSVLNLGAFETFFRERRPFFVEGTGLFREPVNCFIVNDCSTGEGLFYSRRVGRAPRLTDQYATIDPPASSAILGAAKLTGRTHQGLSIGVLDAVTERVRGGPAGDATLEPATNYAVVRSRQDWRDGESNVGLIATAVNRALDSWSQPYLRRDAYVGGVDFYHRFPGKRYQLSGQVNFSQIAGTPAVIAATQTDPVHYYQRPDAGLGYDPTRTSLAGNSAEFRFAKFGGARTNVETAIGRRSAGFEINDLGFLRRADEQNWSSWMALRWRTPKAFYQSIQWNFNLWHHWTTGGLPLEHAFNSNVHVQFNSRWWLHTGGTLGRLGRVYCDRCARGGPAVLTDPTISWWGGIEPDDRRQIQPSVWANYWRADGGRTESINLSPSLDFRAGSRLAASVGLSWTRNRDNTQWYDNVDDAAGTTHYLFAHLEQHTLSMTWRIDYTLTPNITLQVYASPFVSKGTYSDLRELAAPRAAVYDDRYQPPTLLTLSAPGGFNFKEFRSNVVFRWEYRPGSVLFLVWQQGRQDQRDLEGSRPLGGDLRDVFRLPADNAFLLKASYWINW
ncbi:MAG: carbohydrate binding family 9 domain-containing protein [Gemmatimonadetes bacterium]|nr:carbohydrate binding family 9 domain-containing protein [Gemmatimonadota bacterium]